MGIAFAALFTASIFTPLNFASGFLPKWCGGVLFALVGAVGVFFAVKYAAIARRYKELSNTNE
jgi:hypothetical protein